MVVKKKSMGSLGQVAMNNKTYRLIGFEVVQRCTSSHILVENVRQSLVNIKTCFIPLYGTKSAVWLRWMDDALGSSLNITTCDLNNYTIAAIIKKSYVSHGATSVGAMLQKVYVGGYGMDITKED